MWAGGWWGRHVGPGRVKVLVHHSVGYKFKSDLQDPKIHKILSRRYKIQKILNPAMMNFVVNLKKNT